MSKDLYDLSILSDMVYGDTKFMQELVDTFIEYAPIDASDLDQLTIDKNWLEVSKKAHKLKSSIRTIGITSLSSIIEKIETDAKNLNQLEDIPSKVTEFINTLSLIIDKLKLETINK